MILLPDNLKYNNACRVFWGTLSQECYLYILNKEEKTRLRNCFVELIQNSFLLAVDVYRLGTALHPDVGNRGFVVGAVYAGCPGSFL